MVNIKKLIATLVGLGILGGVVYGAAVIYDLNRHYSDTTEQVAGDELTQKIARGAYVATASDCIACHTAEGGKPFAGGYKMNTPFGPIFSSNITSDKDTGIGSWTKGQFDAAVRHGKGSHGYLYPAMPYNAYIKLNDQDVDDLWAYMKSVPAVNHKVVENQLPFPYNQRWLLGGWNFLFFHSDPFKPVDNQSAVVNRGAYLVQGAGHCAACHTAKNALGGDVSDAFQGGTLQGWHAPDLTSNSQLGLGKWTEQDIVDYLQKGSNRYNIASGPMAEAVENSTQHLSDEDLHAMAAWLKTLPASKTAVTAGAAVDTTALNAGKTVFETQCSACHISSGKGVPNMITALAGNPQLNAEDPSTILNVILQGASSAVTAGNPTGAKMPRFDWKLSDKQVADVTSYIRSAWGNSAPAVSEEAVAQARQTLQAQGWHGEKK